MAAAKAMTCTPELVLEHSVKLQGLKDGQENLEKGQDDLETKQGIATSSRATLHKRIDSNTARMNKWVWIAYGAGGVISVALATIGFLGGVFWWAINNNVVVTAATAIKDAG